ncbi:hypothetical protein MT325_M625R [Paramecium bursaria chlorella virus MT325]|uniref:Uncharacterized protein M625R n=1 Tax=Paramecium bursaria Chlorella virus MT325 TaxID=346932 RepID=A7IV05_PBCVM|nr:hypothetical protein MT325_M625R [Paramecium bursaria chlorella virus MT325]
MYIDKNTLLLFKGVLQLQFYFFHASHSLLGVGFYTGIDNLGPPDVPWLLLNLHGLSGPVNVYVKRPIGLAERSLVTIEPEFL